MKKFVFPLIAGIAVSYCFSSMVLNARIVNPVTAFQNKSLVLSMEELLSGVKDFEILPDNQLRSTSADPWIEIGNILNRVGRLHSVVYKIKVLDAPDAVTTDLFYADTGQGYHAYRTFTAPLEEKTVIEIPDHVGPIDTLRMDLININDTTIEIDEISFNTDRRFSAPLMAFIYALWCLVILLDFGVPIPPRKATPARQLSP